MTNKEAIRILGLECDEWDISHCTASERREAFEMAISALQELDKNPTKPNNSNEQLNNSTATQFNAIKTHVKGLTACRVPEVAKDTNVHSTDLISRQAAIDTLKMDISIIPFAKAREYVRAAIETIYNRLEELPPAQPDQIKYEYHYDHTDCIWYRPEARNRCPVTCAQYRDGWNDAMNYIFRNGKGYRPYRRDTQYGE